MQSLITKEQAATYLGLKTPEAAEKLLARLGVSKINYALIGGKGVRYRKSDVDVALSAIEISPQKPSKKSHHKKIQTNFFDLSVSEQMALLTTSTPAQ